MTDQHGNHEVLLLLALRLVFQNNSAHKLQQARHIPPCYHTGKLEILSMIHNYRLHLQNVKKHINVLLKTKVLLHHFRLTIFEEQTATSPSEIDPKCYFYQKVSCNKIGPLEPLNHRFWFMDTTSNKQQPDSIFLQLE